MAYSVHFEGGVASINSLRSATKRAKKLCHRISERNARVSRFYAVSRTWGRRLCSPASADQNDINELTAI